MKILNRNSLVCLAKQIKNDESHLLGVCLGMRAEKISSIYRMYRHSAHLCTFYVLYEWRGRKTQPELADLLIKVHDWYMLKNGDVRKHRRCKHIYRESRVNEYMAFFFCLENVCPMEMNGTLTTWNSLYFLV